jgi:hypothetical protein
MVMIVDHGTWQLTAEDEKPHPAGPQLLWCWACLVRPGRPAASILFD